MPRLVSRGLNADEFAAQKNGLTPLEHKVYFNEFQDHDTGHTNDLEPLNERGLRHLDSQMTLQSEPETPRLVDMQDLKFKPDEIMKFKLIFNSVDKDGTGNVCIPYFSYSLISNHNPDCFFLLSFSVERGRSAGADEIHRRHLRN